MHTGMLAMTPNAERYVQVSVTLERREDGGLRAYSEDVPGFVLSHHDEQALLADIAPALEMILSAMFKAKVVTHRLVGVRDALRALDEDELCQVAVPSAYICAEKYVARVG